ncbi:hypothetical protein KHQ82_00930 [Mycoplasmatota bacterium]|nr:hypothetical protein KHQ82_00930 [Mycoplasmatota bacterium]
MKVVIFIQTSKSGTSREAIRACEDMNLYTILLTNNKKQISQRIEYPDVHEMIYMEELSYKNICDYINNQMDDFFKVESILSFIDGYSALSSRLRDRYTINTSNTKAIQEMENMSLTWTKLRRYPFMPKQVSLDKNSNILEFPLIIRSIETPRELNVVSSITDIPSHYDLEKVYIEGYNEERYRIEVLVKDGKPISLIKLKFDMILTKNNSLVVSGYTLSENLNVIDAEMDMIKAIIYEFNYRNGVFCIEVNKSGDNYHLVDLKPNVSEDSLNDIIYSASNINYIEQIIRFYLGKEFLIPSVKRNVYSKFIIINESGVLVRVTGTNAAMKKKGIEKIFMRTRRGNSISEPSEIGYVIATGSNKVEARKNALSATSEIEFQFKEGLLC